MPEIAGQVDILKATLIGGWMSERELTWLATMASSCNKIVEFGCHHGRSTRAIADNAPLGAKIWAVDPWGGNYKNEDGTSVNIDTYVMPQFRHNLHDHIVSGKVIPVRQFSHKFGLDEKVDMVFLDGDHRFEAVYRDIIAAKRLLKPEGLLCGHDYDHPEWPGVKLAIDAMSLKVEREDLIWWTRKF